MNAKQNLSFVSEVASLQTDERQLQQTAERLERARKKNQNSTAPKPATQKPKSETSATNRRPIVGVGWGEPTASLNTRIPPRLSMLLDDLLYQSKKKDKKKSKQSLVIEALEDLLCKHKLALRKPRGDSQSIHRN